MLLRTDAILQPRHDAVSTLAALLPESRFGAMRALLDAKSRADDSPLTGLTGITVRFEKIRVIDNHARFPWLVAADVYSVIAVVSNATATPVEVHTAGAFSGVGNETDLPLDAGTDSEYFRALDGVPSILDLHVVLMRSNQGIRDPAVQLASALDSAPGRSLWAALEAHVSAGNPGSPAAVTAVTSSLLTTVVSFMARDTDVQIFYGIASFEDDPDNLGIGRTWRLTDSKNASIDFEVLPRRG